jgi:hypothetical protein
LRIRTFEHGDETVQASIYNEAAGALPKFKPAAAQEVLRRVNAPDFDPQTRFYAEKDGKIVAYAAFNANGRVSTPWCRKGYEELAGPLFDHTLQAMRQHGHRKVFAAYRGDWVPVLDFLRRRGFTVVREMVNFISDIVDMPTAPGRPATSITPLTRKDVPELYALAPNLFRCHDAVGLEHHLFDNPYFAPSSLFVQRRRDQSVLGAGLLINNGGYADPKLVDAGMPCFRLGAFGTEGMQTKRIKGLFSCVCRDDNRCPGTAMDLMGHAVMMLQDSDDIAALAAQVPSDVPHLLRFYQMNFQRQGSFPVLECALEPT